MTERVRNPYPGAQPLESDDADLLYGRDEDLARFVRAVTSHCVVELVGASGVGKSSLVRAGLVGRLNRESDLIVCQLKDWHRVEPGTGEAHYAHALALALGPLANSLPDHRADPYSFVLAVQRVLGARLVVVFDQLDELLRDEPETGRTFLENVADVAMLVPQGYTQVVSVRQEFKYELSSIEQRLGELCRIFPIGPVAVSAIAEIVTKPLEGVEVTAAPQLVDAILNAWKLAAMALESEMAKARVAAASHEADVGLLHLQAFLWAMFDAIQPSVGSQIEAADVEAATEIEFPVTGVAATEFFGSGLELYVSLMMRARADWYVVEQGETDEARLRATETIGIATAIPAHLSSAGFKLTRGTDDLAGSVLHGLRDLHDFGAVARGEATPAVGAISIEDEDQSLAKVMARLCREAALAEDGDRLEQKVLVELEPLSDRWGDNGMVCGRMTGRSALRTACELAATYERAILWLLDSHVLRTPRAPSEAAHARAEDDRMVSLVHDGFGRASNRWAAREREQPMIRITSVVKMTGKQVLFRPVGDERDALTPADLPYTDNLGWIGCNVTAHFKDLVFRNCDLRSTLFNYCRFTNVVFEDCLTHGILFLETTFEGEDGFVIRGTNPVSEPTSRVQTLTVGPGCKILGGGLTLERIGGYGLFLDGAVGGPWTLSECEIEHVRVHGGHGGVGPGTIVDSPRLTHVAITGATGHVDVSGSHDIAYLEDLDRVVHYAQRDEPASS